MSIFDPIYIYIVFEYPGTFEPSQFFEIKYPPRKMLGAFSSRELADKFMADKVQHLPIRLSIEKYQLDLKEEE